MKRITKETVESLSISGYFDKPDSPACVAILPFVMPEHTGVEIGVFMGDSSECFLAHCRFMYFIDPCIGCTENPDIGVFASQDKFEQRLLSKKNQFQFIRKMSADAAPEIPEADFVFIDGNHMYDYVKQDIELYWPKVRSGGFLSGHDYGPGHDDVIRAVDEFSQSVNLPLEIH